MYEDYPDHTQLLVSVFTYSVNYSEYAAYRSMHRITVYGDVIAV